MADDHKKKKQQHNIPLDYKHEISIYLKICSHTKLFTWKFLTGGKIISINSEMFLKFYLNACPFKHPIHHNRNCMKNYT